jgi:uncharacterized membrane protein YbhN (UPF0104 family)/uncharacterized membrane protein YhaH (DUF805 family)
MTAGTTRGDGEAVSAGSMATIVEATGPQRPTVKEPKHPARRHEKRSWRALFFAPVGDGQTRRRGSDAFRLGSAVMAVVLCWVVTRANSKSEHSIATTLASAPNGLHWLISTIWWVGSVGIIILIAVLALISRRWSAVRDVGISGLAAWLVCVILVAVLGTTGGRPPTGALGAFNLGFPVARVAATVGVATAAFPYLSRWLQRTVETAIVLLAVATVMNHTGLPVAVVASLAVGWGMTALVHLIFGSPLGLPSVAEVSKLLADLEIAASDVTPVAEQEWGVGKFHGQVEGSNVDVSVYGRDAADAQLLAKTMRFLFYRDSGPTLTLTRRQQVEHEAYLMLMAERAGARVPEVLAAGGAGPANDALLISKPPTGRSLAEFEAYVLPTPPPPPVSAKAEERAKKKQDKAAKKKHRRWRPGATDASAVSEASGECDPGASSGADSGLQASGDALGRASTGEHVSLGAPLTRNDPLGAEPGSRAPSAEPPAPVIDDGALDEIFGQVLTLQSSGMAHGSISTQTIVVDEDNHAGLIDFRSATTAATDEQLSRDVAAAMAAASIVAGPERTVASAVRSFPPATVTAALPFLQKAALDTKAAKAVRGKKPILNAVREQGAAAVGVEVPKLIEPRRISWVTLAMVVGTLVGGWALIGVLVNVGKSWDTIEGANWAWVALVFVFAQAAYPAIAITTVGSVTDPLPYGRTLALELSDTFVALAGGSMAVLATRVRFFQQEGYTPTVAVSSGVLVSTASWIVKGALFLIAIPFALSNLHFSQTESSSTSSDGGNGHLVWLIIVIVIAVGVVLGLVFAVPRWRRLAADKLRPRASEMLAHLKILATHPKNLIEIFGGNVAAQIFVALALGAALHAFGDHLGLATLLVVLTLASMLGGMSPVPGGMGVVEAGMILCLQAAGISQSDAVAATFVQRLFTAYLPPIWGWFVLVWMRRKEYL